MRVSTSGSKNVQLFDVFEIKYQRTPSSFMNWHGHNFNYSESLQYHQTKLKLSLGNQEFEKVYHQVRGSTSLNKFISRIGLELPQMPNQLLVTNQIMETRAFLFTANYSKILAGSIFLFDWWVQEVNKTRRIATESDLVDNLERIVARVENISTGRI